MVKKKRRSERHETKSRDLLRRDAGMRKTIILWNALQFLEGDHATTHSFKLDSTYHFLEDPPPLIFKKETELLYFYAFLYPDSTINDQAHQASSDRLMLAEGMRALIDLAHWEEFGTGELGIDEQMISAATAAGEANVVDSRQQRVSRGTILVRDAPASQSLKRSCLLQYVKSPCVTQLRLISPNMYF